MTWMMVIAKMATKGLDRILRPSIIFCQSKTTELISSEKSATFNTFSAFMS